MNIFILTRFDNAVALLAGDGLAIYRSRVRVLAGHHCVVILGKLLRPTLCHQAVKFGTGQRGDLCGWEGNRGPGGK